MVLAFCLKFRNPGSSFEPHYQRALAGPFWASAALKLTATPRLKQKLHCMAAELASCVHEDYVHMWQ